MTDKIMVFKIPEEMYMALNEKGEQQERTKAFLIRKAIQKFLEDTKKLGGKNATDK